MDQVEKGSPCLHARPRRRPRQRGFTLLDVGLGLLSLSLAAVLAFTSSVRRQQAARCVRVGEELRALAGAFQDFAAERSARPPANFDENAIPKGMEPFLRDTPWLKETPVGGHYRWTAAPPEAKDGASGELLGSIIVTAFSPDAPLALTPADLHRIDVLIDDGNLATGNFRAGFNGWPVFLVRAKK
jgi:type II secretory pathway pseudopilin PulG